ncbi:coagulation factor XIII A chain-like [Genypterus blacodes]|uniref:coagulation factor XIII A chain-like n=1 Tax=Genypterus blacodes TaxID=154954 RepID=UPI003F758537
MSLPYKPSQGPISTGRYPQPIPTTNLVEDDDVPEFEPFEDAEGSEIQPRGPASGYAELYVVSVDMLQQTNKLNHYTSDYDIQNLVIRRGLEFFIRVTFNRELTQTDDYQLEFMIGQNPTANKGSMVVVTFNSRQGCAWAGRLVKSEGASLLLGVTPTAEAIVGRFRTYVAVVATGGMQRTKRDPSTDLYMLFNAWCPEDSVFLPDEQQRSEYILNDSGEIYQGSHEYVTRRPWMFGQFEAGVLEACIYILDVCRMPIFNRGDVIKLVRMASALVNSQDDNGVLVGNWSDDFSLGTPPTLWTGSVKILLEYAKTGNPICYAQCWVFAGVFNTFLRCLGIPARVITNFNSAHDNTGNLKTELIFRTDGTPDRRNTRDSIWNYHCWNEIFITRPDLPTNLWGWQVVDATPQETSDGSFRCGPASVAAIKDGLLCHPFDAGFCFAEVNSNVIFLKRDRYGTMTPFRVDKLHVGKLLCTKAVGSNQRIDITHEYKHQEGSAENDRTMQRAEEYGCRGDNPEIPDKQLNVTIMSHTDKVLLGQDINLVLVCQNLGDQTITMHSHLTASVVFYTGISSVDVKNEDFTVTVQPFQTEHVYLTTKAAEYLPHMGRQLCLHFTVTGQTPDQSVSVMKSINLQPPALTLTVSGQPQVSQEMVLTVSFTNPFNYPLYNVFLAMEGPGLMSFRTHGYSVIEALASITWLETFIPRLQGTRRLMAAMVCHNLPQVDGTTDIVIQP